MSITSSFTVAYCIGEDIQKVRSHLQSMFHKKKINNATGLNYLVREVGPALIGRSIALRAQSDDGDGEGDSNDVAIPEHKRKRKLVNNR
mmetsp:Transcript_33363/g.37949  ORF Transcript_33363/g.37949 Transcript_33363/m.37949 type:complete len:89 (+) Transcript_33363:112-378(+)